MRISTIASFLPLKHNPYEEDCCGSHDREAVEIYDYENHTKLVITEVGSGLGASFRVHLESVNNPNLKSKEIQLFQDDEGVVCVYTQGREI